MDRRSFITMLVGGFAVASLGGAAMAQAGQKAAPMPEPVDEGVGLDAKALDQADAEFSQYYYYRRRPRWRRRFYYRRPYGHYRRPYRRYRRFDWRARRR